MLSIGGLRQAKSLEDLTTETQDRERSTFGSNVSHHEKVGRDLSGSATALHRSPDPRIVLLASNISQADINKRRVDMQKELRGYSKDHQFLTPPARMDWPRRYTPSYLNTSASDNDFGIYISSNKSSDSVSPPQRIYGPSSGRNSGRVTPTADVEFYTGYIPHGHFRRSSYDYSVYNPTSYSSIHKEYHGPFLSDNPTSARKTGEPKVPLAKYGSMPLLDNLHDLADKSDRLIRKRLTPNNQQQGSSLSLHETRFSEPNIQIRVDSLNDLRETGREHTPDQNESHISHKVDPQRHDNSHDSHTLFHKSNTPAPKTSESDGASQFKKVSSPDVSDGDVREKLNNIFSRQLGLNALGKSPATLDSNKSPYETHGKNQNHPVPAAHQKHTVPAAHIESTGQVVASERPTTLPVTHQGVTDHSDQPINAQRLPHQGINGHNNQVLTPPVFVQQAGSNNPPQAAYIVLPDHSLAGHNINPTILQGPFAGGQNINPTVLHVPFAGGQNIKPTVLQVPFAAGQNINPTLLQVPYAGGQSMNPTMLHVPVAGYGPYHMAGFNGQIPTGQTLDTNVSVPNLITPNIPVSDFRSIQQTLTTGYHVNNNIPQNLNNVSKPEIGVNFTKESKSQDKMAVDQSDDPEPDYLDSESGISYDLGSSLNKKNKDDAISLAKTNDDNFDPEEKDMTWRPYDIFTVSEREADDDNKVFKEILKSIRGSLYIIIVAVMLVGTVSSRVALYLLASDINQKKTRGTSVVLLMFCMCGPMVYNWLNAFMKILFGGKEWPSIKTFAVMLFFELVTTFGMCLLVFKILPSVDFFRGITITLAMFQIPAICQVMMLDRKPNCEYKTIIKMVTSVLAMLVQIGAIVFFMLMDFVPSRETLTVLNSKSKEERVLDTLLHESVWELPVALILISFGWWENYVSSDWTLFGRVHISFKHWRHVLQETRETSYFLIGPFKIGLVVILGKYLADADFALPTWSRDTRQTQADFHGQSYSLMYITLGSAILCTYLSGLACKLHMQKTAFALPLVLSPPASLVLVYLQCRYEFIPRHWHSGSWFCPHYDIENLIQPIAVAGTLWLSYCIIVSHIWFPKSERMAKIEKLFLTPHFNAIFPDFNLTLRRRRNDQELRATRFEHFTYVGDDAGDHVNPEGIAMEENTVTPTIFVCATMWHETQREMTQLLKSLFRLDYSHCASKLAQAKFNIRDPDYFDMEIHIIFDDAFDIDLDANKFVPNNFVKQFIDCMEDAARSVVKGFIIIPSPVKVVTPYGGRLIWTMPGQTQMVVHLKDKNKIRHRKRWSQCMYLYYLLGYRLLGAGDGSEVKEEERTPLPNSNLRNRKKIRKDKKRGKSNLPLKQLLMRVPPEHYEQIVETSENTFILTLDGDVDFRPDSVKLLIDRMKKNKKVGAVCGRIHPIGSGPMVWYQQFEYAIGHWLQKAAEHVFGCVLCCPGCFSLFRGSAVMDDNVMKMYTTKPTEARHFIQFEQGEDRWLCTLLLQQGHRIDYSAGADALTYAPETFNEFFNQRRRWSPSTLANMMDLLASWRDTVRLNDNISRLYVLYQFTLMASSILAPSTVVLMITSSYHAVIGLNNWWSYVLSVVPVALYTVVCLTTKTNTQVKVGAVLTAIYTVVMMIATVGTIISIATENFSSPNVVFITGLGVIFITAALLHPQEIYCLVYGALYFLVVPSTFILLTVFYLCNLNNVSWGTREVPKKMTAEEEEAIKKAEEEKKKKKKSWNIFTTIGLMNIVNELREIIRNIWGLRHDLQQGQLEQSQTAKPQEPSKPVNAEPAKPKKVKKEVTGYEPDPDNPHWLHLEDMGTGPVEVLDNSEHEFWKFLIKKYLYPIEENKEQKEKIAADLLEVRNNVVFIYIMLNFLWTVIALQLQTSEDALKDYYIVKKYEPMSLLFLVIFASVMVVQALSKS
ncbi:hypothetical protein Btru_014017 [Bulinus truncatus]|nr:hypothetical protein Btru_014017 [Bulinus truncatus]